MAAARDPHDENIRALEQLRAGSTSKSEERRSPAAPSPKTAQPTDEPIFPDMPDRPPPPAPTPPPLRPTRQAAPPPPRPTSSDDAPTYHCLECGYALLAQSGYRCSECGKRYDPGFLAAWFEGTEEDRFNHLTWLVNSALFFKGCAFLMVAVAPLGYPQTCLNLLVIVAGAAAAIAACVLAGRDRMDTIAGYYAMSGCAAAGLAGLGVLFGGLSDRSSFSWPAMVLAMDALSGAMLLLTLLYPIKGINFWHARTLRKTVLPIAIALFPSVFILYTLEKLLRDSFTNNGGAVPAFLNVLNTTLLAAAANLAIWILARHWIVSFRRVIFAPADSEEEQQE